MTRVVTKRGNRDSETRTEGRGHEETQGKTASTSQGESLEQPPSGSGGASSADPVVSDSPPPGGETTRFCLSRPAQSVYFVRPPRKLRHLPSELLPETVLKLSLRNAGAQNQKSSSVKGGTSPMPVLVAGR